MRDHPNLEVCVLHKDTGTGIVKSHSSLVDGVACTHVGFTLLHKGHHDIESIGVVDTSGQRRVQYIFAVEEAARAEILLVKYLTDVYNKEQPAKADTVIGAASCRQVCPGLEDRLDFTKEMLGLMGPRSVRWRRRRRHRLERGAEGRQEVEAGAEGEGETGGEGQAGSCSSPVSS